MMNKEVEMEEYVLKAGASENKRAAGDAKPLPQLLGAMEKIAGDLAKFHLKSTSSKVLFKRVWIYGIVIDYSKDSCTMYKLEMNFTKIESILYICDDKVPIVDAIKMLYSTLVANFP